MKHASTGVILWVVALQAIGQVSICSGNGGNAHVETTPLAAGTTVTLSVTGGANQPYSLSVAGFSVTPIPGFGTVCIDLAGLTEVLVGILPPSGQIDFSFAIPGTSDWLAFLTYLQGAVVDPLAPAGFGLTNTLRIDFEVPDSWTPVTPGLQSGRAYATATLLPSGRVLVAGGGAYPSFSFPTPNAAGPIDLYDPLTRGFIPGPALLHPRMLHTATPLLDGRVLLAGGATTGFGSPSTETCEIFDPATASLLPAASMSLARLFHTATRLADGRVLVVGGAGIANPTTGEVYDPAANTWTPVANTLQNPRSNSSAARLGDGRVLIVSGMSNISNCFGVIDPSPACDFYDPATNQFSPAPPIPGLGVLDSVATTLQDGTVFVSGGQFGPPNCMGTLSPGLNATGIFDGAAWSAGPNLPVGVTLHSQTLLKNGGVLVVGGALNTFPAAGAVFSSSSPSSQCVRYLGGVMQTKASLPLPRYGHTAVRLEDGSVLVAGGYGPGTPGYPFSTTALLYMPDP